MTEISLFDPPPPPVTVTGRPAPFSGFKRYRLSNGWFADGASRSYGYHQGWKYSLWEPGAGPLGGAAFRGGAPTLKLILAVANGKTLCGQAPNGCRQLAIGFEVVTVHGGRYRRYHCAGHAPGPAAPPAAGDSSPEPGSIADILKVGPVLEYS